MTVWLSWSESGNEIENKKWNKLKDFHLSNVFLIGKRFEHSDYKSNNKELYEGPVMELIWETCRLQT